MPINSKPFFKRNFLTISIVQSFFLPLSGLPSTPIYSILFNIFFEPSKISGSSPSASNLKNFIFLILLFKTYSSNFTVAISIFFVKPEAGSIIDESPLLDCK